MMASQTGVRIRLDLSAFEKVAKKQFRWTYLPYEEFSTIKDVKDHIKTKFLPKTDQSNKIRLYLEEPFWLPASESIRILQNGDLVLVKSRDGDSTNDSETSSAKRRKVSDASLNRNFVPKVVSAVVQRNVTQLSKSSGKYSSNLFLC